MSLQDIEDLPEDIQPNQEGHIEDTKKMVRGLKSLKLSLESAELGSYLNPISKSLYPASDVTSYEIVAAPPSYTGMTYIGYDSGRINFLGAQRPRMTVIDGMVYNFISGSTGSISAHDIEFYHRGNDFSVHIQSYANGDVQIYVDEQRMLPTTGTEYLPGSPGINFLNVKFATSKVRKIRVALGKNPFVQVLVPAVDNIFPSEPRMRAVAIGDSYFEGADLPATGSIHSRTLVGALKEKTGWDIYNYGQGGTGYINNGAAGSSGLGPSGVAAYGHSTRRAAFNALPSDVKIAIICGGANDGTFTPAAVKAAAIQLYADIYTDRPNVSIIVAGVEAGVYDNISADLDLINTAIKEAALAAPNVIGFIDMRGTPKWITGTGNAGSIQNDGNADIFKASDNVHPTMAGNQYLADRFVSEFRYMKAVI